MSIKTMIEQYADLTELQAFAESQYKVIIDLNSKNKKLEEEVRHLKHLLSNSAPLIDLGVSPNGVSLTDDEEVICRTQLAILKDEAMKRPLTLEEAKKTELYTKILFQKKNEPKTIKVEARTVKSEDLLALAESESESNN